MLPVSPVCPGRGGMPASAGLPSPNPNKSRREEGSCQNEYVNIVHHVPPTTVVTNQAKGPFAKPSNLSH